MTSTNKFIIPVVASELEVSGPADFQGSVTFAEVPTTSTGAPVAQLNELFVLTPTTTSGAVLTVPAGETWVVEAAMLVIAPATAWTGGTAPVLNVGYVMPAFSETVTNGFLAAVPLDAGGITGFAADQRGIKLWDTGVPIEQILVAGSTITVAITVDGATAGVANLLIQGRKFQAVQLTLP